MDLEMTQELTITVERLAAAATLLQQAAERLSERESTFTLDAEATLTRVVATIESQRETELTQQLAAAEARIAALLASAPTTVTHSVRKTLPSSTLHLLAKQGVSGDAIPSMEAGALDAALVSLSLEQRIAVKAQLLRSGLLG
jgi:hypothetical protein